MHAHDKLPAPVRIVILGNAGSGKTTMARRIIAEHGEVREIAYLSLDDIAWSEGNERKPPDESLDELRAFIEQNENWIIEGCYGSLVEAALAHATELRFLNPGVEVCIRNCRSRPWEADKFDSPAAQDEMLSRLIEWVAQYESRDDEFGLANHRVIYDRFDGSKREYNGPQPLDHR